MADVKKVLVVDDHFEMLEFLRSMLELSEYDYEVLAVPSAEEGMYELRRSTFDLLITDVRLPGMSGFDLARRARGKIPDLPIIMITAYSSPQGKKEAEELGVYRYFGKPLDTDEVLTAINNLLHEPKPEEKVASAAPSPSPQTAIKLSAGVDKRLTTLGTDTGAAQVLLATVNGQILRQVGPSHDMDLSPLAAIIAGNLSNSMQLGEHLGGDAVATIQYHAGKRMEMYTANVGPDYFLLIVFEVQVRRGRFGTIWVFAQRAIKDLLPLLPSLDAAAEALPVTKKEKPARARSTRKASPAKPSTPIPRTRRGRQSKPAASRSEPPPKKEKKTPKPSAPEPPSFFIDAEATPTDGVLDQSADMEIDLKSLLGATELPDSAEIDFEAAAEEEFAAAATAMSLEEAQKMGLIGGAVFSEEENEETAVESADLGDLDGLLAAADDAVDLDDFWDTAVTESESSETSGMSFAEARRQGLIPGDMDAE